MIVYDAIEDCSRCEGEQCQGDPKPAQWCTRNDHGPALWDRDREAPRHYMGGPTEGSMHRPAESREEWKRHACLGAYNRSPFVLSIDRHVRRGGRSNRHYDKADPHVVELTHYYERHLDAVKSLGAEMGALA